MADRDYAPRPLARWFWVGAAASLVFMVAGCISYIVHVRVDPSTLPLDQRAMMEAVPAWMVAAFAVAVWAGLAGAALLVMRRKLAEPLLLVSLIAVIVQFSGYFVDPELREATSANALVIPVVILLLTWTIFWFARHSRQRGWLR
jgi:dipeptide/tripeptide permease